VELPEKVNYDTDIMPGLCRAGFGAKSPDRSRYKQIKGTNKKDSNTPNIMKLAVPSQAATEGAFLDLFSLLLNTLSIRKSERLRYDQMDLVTPNLADAAWYH
jgi:hypothetical protein